MFIPHITGEKGGEEKNQGTEEMIPALKTFLRGDHESRAFIFKLPQVLQSSSH